MSAVCPICREYNGPPASVEAHISGNRDEDHQGEWGSAWRDEIAGPFEETDLDPSGDGGTNDVSTSDVDDSEVRSEAGIEAPFGDGVEATSSAATDDSEVVDQVGSEIAPMTMLLVATALFALIVFVGAVLPDNDDSDEPAESEQGESVEQSNEPDVSLLG